MWRSLSEIVQCSCVHWLPVIPQSLKRSFEISFQRSRAPSSNSSKSAMCALAQYSALSKSNTQEVSLSCPNALRRLRIQASFLQDDGLSRWRRQAVRQPVETREAKVVCLEEKRLTQKP